MIFTAATLATLLPLVLAQDNALLNVQSIDAQFDAAYIVPDLIESFDPVAALAFTFGDKKFAPGSPVTVAESQPQPVLTLTAANSSVTLPGLYTLALVDPGSIGNASPDATRHWLVNGVTVDGSGAVVIPEVAITPYGAPLPAEGSGAHRYVFLLYEQPDTFAPQGDLANPNQPISTMNINEYATSSGLGDLIAGSYFTCEQGTATPATVTEAVDPSTLPAAQESEGSSNSSNNSSPSKSGSGSTPAPTDNGVASLRAPIVAAGAVAMLGFVLA